MEGFSAALKSHVGEHGFHVQHARHFVETYTNHQTWQINLHSAKACHWSAWGPVDVDMSFAMDPGTLLEFEKELERAGMGEPESGITIPLAISFMLPPLESGPDLLLLATDLAGIGGTDLPLEVSAVDSFAVASAGSERTVSIESTVDLGLDDIHLRNDAALCEMLDRCEEVTDFLLAQAPAWLPNQN